MRNFINRILFVFIIISQLSAKAQSGTWTWIRGSALPWSTGNYGTKGVPHPSNEPPARYEPSYWIDLDGNFWLFGGNSGTGVAGLVNDLWKYDPINNLWTWMNGPAGNIDPAGHFGVQGIPSPLNYPQALGYGALNWVDENGDLWLYGGVNFGNQMDGLWRYHIATNEWTWMKGTIGNTNMVPGIQGQFHPLNTPGAISECKSAWVYNNQLWFFGGQNHLGQQLGALWCYDISSNNWSWKSGLTIPYYIGNYGTKGISSPTNFPPARVSYTNWKDAGNNFYLFAGDPTFAFSNFGNNDVWRYSPITNEWTWVSGTANINDLGFGLNYCNADTLNIPRSRIENMSAQSSSKCSNAFWTFGGFNTGGHDFHNDLWLFNPDSNAWKLIKGFTSTGGFGTYVPYNYGIQGIPNSNNLPPGRGGGAIWNDRYGNVWIFGGTARNLNDWAFVNDLWKFEPDTNCFHLMIEAYYFHLPQDTVSLCEGDSFAMNIPTNIEVQVIPNTNVIFDSLQHILFFTGLSTTSYSIIASSLDQNSPCSYLDTFSFHINLISKPNADFTINPLITNLSQPTFTLTNTSTNATTYIWYDSLWNVIGTDTNLVQTFTKAGKYCFTLVASNACNQLDTITHCGIITEEFNTGIQNINLKNEGIYVPNVFTPNQDGVNDFFKPILNTKSKLLNFDIYNRWGNLIFKIGANSNGWNGYYQGQACEEGTYFYLIEFMNDQGKKIKLGGEFNLIR